MGVVLRDEKRFTRWSQSQPRIVVGLVAAGEILERRWPTDSGKIEVDKSSSRNSAVEGLKDFS